MSTRSVDEPAPDQGDDDDQSDDEDFDDLLRAVARAPSVDTLPLDDRELSPGAVLDGSFRIVRRLGRGGMGVVYLADHLQLERKVALKLHSVASGSAGTSRLLREARTMASLVHDNVVTVYDVGTVGQQVYIAMEFVDGGTMRDWLDRQPQAPQEIVRLFVAAGRGLVAAHAAGLVHRDFKPDNVLVGLDGRVRVADFGLARAAEGDDGARLRWRDGASPDSEGRGVAATTEHGLRLTATGALVGTPAYMAPEQHEGNAADARSDQFAFCVSLYEALYGERPFRADSLAELVTRMVVGEPVTPPRKHEVPTWVRRALQRGLSRDPTLRFPTMDALLRELEHDPTVAQRRVLGMAAAVVVVGAGIVVAQHVASLDPCAGGAERMGQVWGPSQGAALQQALADRGGPVGATAGPRVRARLDAHAEAWIAAHRDACEATHLRKAQSDEALDLRMACLDERREELAALVDALGVGDADVAARADQASLSLSPLSPCDDVDALRRIEPIAAADLEAADDIRKEVARAKSWIDAGRYDQSMVHAEQALAQAQVLGYAALEAEALLRVAAARSKQGDREGASAAYERSLNRAVAAGDDRGALMSASALVYADGYQLERFELGERWLRQANAWQQRVGESGTAAVRLDLSEALMRREQGRLHDAIQVLERARASVDAMASDEHTQDLRLGVLGALAVTLRASGDVAASLTVHDEAIALAESLYGPEHPRLATELNNAGGARLQHGDLTGGEALFRRALEIRLASFGPDHPSVLESQLNVANSLLQQSGRLDETAAMLQDAARHAEHVEARIGVELHTMLGGVLAEQDQLERAHAELQKVLTLAHGSWAPDDPRVLRALTNVANLANQRDLHAEAERLAREGLAAIAGSSREALDLPEGYLQEQLGDALGSQRRYAEARIANEAALVKMKDNLGPGHPHLFMPTLHLGQSLYELGELPEAEAVLRQALAMAKELDDSSRATSGFALAQVRWAQGALDEARSLAREALAEVAEIPEGRAEIEAWLQSHPDR